MQTKHLIFGTGLIGSYLAGCFHQNNNQVHLLGRESSKTSLSNGFKLSDFHGNKFVTNDPLEFIEPSSNTPLLNHTFDVIWLTVKCTSIDSVIEPLSSPVVHLGNNDFQVVDVISTTFINPLNNS